MLNVQFKYKDIKPYEQQYKVFQKQNVPLLHEMHLSGMKHYSIKPQTDIEKLYEFPAPQNKQRGIRRYDLRYTTGLIPNFDYKLEDIVEVDENEILNNFKQNKVKVNVDYASVKPMNFREAQLNNMREEIGEPNQLTALRVEAEHGVPIDQYERDTIELKTQYNLDYEKIMENYETERQRIIKSKHILEKNKPTKLQTLETTNKKEVEALTKNKITNMKLTPASAILSQTNQNAPPNQASTSQPSTSQPSTSQTLSKKQQRLQKKLTQQSNQVVNTPAIPSQQPPATPQPPANQPNENKTNETPQQESIYSKLIDNNPVDENDPEFYRVLKNFDNDNDYSEEQINQRIERYLKNLRDVEEFTSFNDSYSYQEDMNYINKALKTLGKSPEKLKEFVDIVKSLKNSTNLNKYDEKTIRRILRDIDNTIEQLSIPDEVEEKQPEEKQPEIKKAKMSEKEITATKNSIKDLKKQIKKIMKEIDYENDETYPILENNIKKLRDEVKEVSSKLYQNLEENMNFYPTFKQQLKKLQTDNPDATLSDELREYARFYINDLGGTSIGNAKKASVIYKYIKQCDAEIMKYSG